MSEKDITSVETEKETQKWPLPFNIGINKLDIIVKALFQAGADTHSVSLGDIGPRTGINLRTLERNIEFLLKIGIIRLEEGKKDSYLLTEKGAEYAKALGTGDMKQTSTILKELFKHNFKELVDFVELRKSSNELTFELLFSQIKTMARLKESEKYPLGVSAPYRAGIYTLIDLLKRADIVPPDIKPEKEPSRAVTTAKKKISLERAVKETPTQTAPMQISAQSSGTLPFVVNINVSIEAKDPESIKQLIELIRELRSEFGRQTSQT
jgi:predicted transcriptional regulator